MAESLRFDIFAIDRASHVFDKVGEHSERMGEKLGRVGKVAAVGLSAVAAGVGAVAIAMGYGLEKASEYQKITGQTGAVLKSTGEKAHVSAEHVKELAEKIASYSGQSREAVQGGENLLLTFTNIQNHAGKTNKIFDQATVALANMTQALGEDPKNAAIQLGKALNDPVKGITALRRVGVSFTADQIKVVKHLVATGQTMKAQKLILAELNTEFGGSAKAAGATFSGSMERLKNSLMDVLVDGLTPLLPGLTKLAGFLSDKIGPAVQTAVNAIQLFIWSFTRNGDVDGLPDKVSDNIVGPIIDAGVAVRKAVDNMLPTIKALIGWFRNQLVPALAKAAQEFLPALGKALSGLGAALKKLAPTFQTLGTILTVAVIPIVAKLATILFTLLGPAFKVIGTVLNTVLVPALKGLSMLFLDVVGVLISGAAKAFGWVPGIGGKLKKAAKDFQTFKDGVNDQLNGIKKGVTIQIHSTLDANLRTILKTVGGQKGAKLAQSLHGTIGAAVAASGTPYSPGGLTMVGEAGPELVSLPKGAGVHTASATSRMGGAGGDFTASAPLVIKLDSGVIWQGLVKFKRQSGRVSLGLS